MIEDLDRDLEETEDEDERDEKEEGIWELKCSHRVFLLGPKCQLVDLDILMDEFQETMDMEKAKALRDEQFRREANERERIRQENRMNEDRRAAQKRTQYLEEAAKKRAQELEEAEVRRKERREEREREMAFQLSAQRRAMDLAKLTHPVVAAEILPTSSSKCKPSCPVKPPRLQLKSFFGDHLRWHEFWDSFSISIHNNTQLDAIGKFLYLKSLIKGDAEKVIAGFSLTEIHYKQAIHALQDRFEDTAVSITDEESVDHRSQWLVDQVPSDAHQVGLATPSISTPFFVSFPDSSTDSPEETNSASLILPQESQDTHEVSSNPEPVFASHSVIGEGPFVKKKKKPKKERKRSSKTSRNIAGSINWKKRRHKRNPSIQRKTWTTRNPRQQKPLKNLKIPRKPWTHFSRHWKQEECPPGRRWSFHNGIRKTKKKEHKFPRGSKFLNYGCQGPKAKMKNRIRCSAMVVRMKSGTQHKELLGRVRKIQGQQGLPPNDGLKNLWPRGVSRNASTCDHCERWIAFGRRYRKTIFNVILSYFSRFG